MTRTIGWEEARSARERECRRADGNRRASHKFPHVGVIGPSIAHSIAQATRLEARERESLSGAAGENPYRSAPIAIGSCRARGSLRAGEIGENGPRGGELSTPTSTKCAVLLNIAFNY